MKSTSSFIQCPAVLLNRVEKSSNHGNKKCTISRRRFNCIESSKILRGTVSGEVKDEVYDPAFRVDDPLRFTHSCEARKVNPYLTGRRFNFHVDSQVKLCLPCCHLETPLAQDPELSSIHRIEPLARSE